MRNNILVTGGAGYIGSHVVKELLAQGQWPISYDSLSQGQREAVIGGQFVEADLSDIPTLRATFKEYSPEAVIHLAASCSVEESIYNPEKYYYNNLINSLGLLKVMAENKVNLIVFSSSCAVYGEPLQVPISEDHVRDPVSPYGKTKLFIENVLADYDQAYNMRYVSLRYFNAAGADPEGVIGENHYPETHLIPSMLQSALGKRDSITIFGTDYPTPDGTCIRDYVHVTDVAKTHILALEALLGGMENRVFNLGSETGYSVKQVIDVAREVTGKEIPTTECKRRQGDAAILVANSERIKRELAWKPELSDIKTIVETAWKWHRGQT